MLQLHLAPLTGPLAPEQRSDLSRLLTREEGARWAAFRREVDRDLWLRARALQRTALGEILGVAPDALRFVEGGGEKPELEGTAPPLRFNLSHTTGLAALATHPTRVLGVDVEARDRVVDTRVAVRYFAPSEVEDLLALPEVDQAERFLETWTLKEAFLKARGSGLRTPLATFAYRFGSGGVLDLEQSTRLPDHARQWWCGQARHGGHHLAIVVEGAEPPEIAVWNHDLDGGREAVPALSWRWATARA